MSSEEIEASEIEASEIEASEIEASEIEASEIDNQKISIKKSTFNGLIVALIGIAIIATFFAGMYVSNFDSNQVSEEELQEAISKLELKLLQNQLPTGQPTPIVKISADNDPIIGDPNAPISIIEFSDFQCPFCARFHIQTLPSILEEYVDQGKVKLIFRDLPIQNIHPNALPASVAAECANEQGKFKEMHDELFENQKEWSGVETANAVSLFSQYALEMGLEQEVFDSCLTNGKYIEEIRNDLNDGRTYGVSGTPGFFIGNDQIGYVELKGAQPFESFKKVIDAQLNT